MRSNRDAVGVMSPSSIMSWIGPSVPGRNPPAFGFRLLLYEFWPDEEGGRGALIAGGSWIE